MKTLTLREAQALYDVLDTSQATLEPILVERDGQPYVLLGRDVLNYFYARLNGPDLAHDLSQSPIGRVALRPASPNPPFQLQSRL